jgi:hypothetical protein
LRSILCELLQRLGYTGEAFRRNEGAQRIAHFRDPAFDTCERSRIGAGVTYVIDAIGKPAHLAFERLDRPARQGLLQYQAHFGEIATQPVGGHVEAAGRSHVLVGTFVAGVLWAGGRPRLDALLQSRIENGGIEPFAGGHAATTRGFARFERLLSHPLIGHGGSISCPHPYADGTFGVERAVPKWREPLTLARRSMAPEPSAAVFVVRKQVVKAPARGSKLRSSTGFYMDVLNVLDRPG